MTKYLWLEGGDRFDRRASRSFGQLRASNLETARAWAIKGFSAKMAGSRRLRSGPVEKAADLCLTADVLTLSKAKNVPGYRLSGNSQLTRLLAAGLLCLCVCGPSHPVVAQEQRPLTAADAVAMTELMRAFHGISKVSFSPDKRKFVIVTRSPNLTTGDNDFALTVYETNEVLAFVNTPDAENSPQTRPAGEVLLRLSSPTNDEAIQRLRWLPTSQALAFIGVSTNHTIPQVYRYDLESRHLVQLTDHPDAVFSFDLNGSGDVVFNAHTPILTEKLGKSYFVGNQNILEMLRLRYSSVPFDTYEGRTPLWYRTYFKTSGVDGPARALGKNFAVGMFPRNLWLSPDSRWAIGAQSIPEYPKSWQGYWPLMNDEYLQQTVAGYDENTDKAGDRVIPLFRLVLFDIEDGTQAPLFDAPIVSGGFQPFDLEWLPDDESILVGNTFLPLDVPDKTERERRRQSSATIEFNIKSKQIIRIVEHVIPIGEPRATEPYAGMERLPDGALAIKKGRQQVERRYEKRKGKWIETKDQRHARENELENPLKVSVREDLETPPDLLATDENTGREKQLTVLNPQFDELTFGGIEVLRWQATSGEDWEGALVFPPSYQPGKCYPLVIQTHGYRKDRFLIEGPEEMKGAFAAQALANKDIVVLQMPDHFRGVNAEERKIHRLGIESAIDKLGQMGLVDRTRVGLIGFSRTGHYVQHAITFSDYDFAAATIADAFNMSFMDYLVNSGSSVGGMTQVEMMMDGAVPWGERLNDWIAQNPSMHTDRVKTPLRLEQYTELINWWDIYVLLKRQGKPTEWLIIADGDHQLQRPLQRLMVQQGNVDWFTFWLKGEEDPDPGKAEQYKRWRKLREQQKKSEAAATKARS